MLKLNALIAVIAAAVVLPAAAPGKGSPGVIRSGKCIGGGATWKLKAKNEDARLEVEFEVDPNIVGRRWKITMSRGRTVIFRGARYTRAPSGSFTVQRLVANPPGRDTIIATARPARGNQLCRAMLTV